MNTATSTQSRFSPFFDSILVVRALALSVLVGATMTAFFLFGTLVPQPATSAVVAPTKSVVQTLSATETWVADDSATGTAPDRAH